MCEWEMLDFNMDLDHPCGQNLTLIRINHYLGVTLITSHNFDILQNCLEKFSEGSLKPNEKD